ncbi:MAG: hypothetical protein A2381_13775 [Bdellovibrionales bacterium RIFOXYB1_FULL_37_110]|nr:MAG: hypothetical protein A2417_05410 [Bdellovibrionales bacterium RIFOXYC1_FULL_37_79]OFZ56929.1 MAG: hypothetical protein A2381_13775 [Bdellovibrionales bacterium RIFOXYB1_FULL_37_110]OFZ62016.1 MAG: hypothetical protein A2577_19245 [Bdellovibrionales bacterium RIFOXYD1_FULL_36_51]
MKYGALISALTFLSFSISAFSNTVHEYTGGTIYTYNKTTKRHDIKTDDSCSLALQFSRVYLDTEHGSPRTQLEMNYEITTDAQIRNKYLSGIAQTSTCDKNPDEYCSPTVTVNAFFPGGLVSGVRVKISFSSNYYQQDVTHFDTVRPEVSGFTIGESNSATGYFGGDGNSWSYQCQF